MTMTTIALRLDARAPLGLCEIVYVSECLFSVAFAKDSCVFRSERVRAPATRNFDFLNVAPERIGFDLPFRIYSNKMK